MNDRFAESAQESAKRRSHRLLLQVPVIIRREGDNAFTEEARTLIVNAHGALVSLAAAVRVGETLYMMNKSSGEEQACRVAHVGPPAGGQPQIGLEFLQPAPEFWHVKFPPEDWSAASSARRTEKPG